MKSILLKLRTLLVVLLLIAGAGIIIWFLEESKGLVMNDSGILGTIIFAVLGLGLIFIFAYFIMRKRKATPFEKDISKIQNEEIYNEIKRKHSS